MPDLSRSEKNFLSHLEFRESGDDGRQSWLLPISRGRQQLVVWTMMGCWAKSPFVKNESTIHRLESNGFVELGDHQPMPDPYNGKRGRTVALTATARQAINKEKHHGKPI